MFTEDNIFEIVIPVSGVADLTVGPSETDKETSKETNKEIADKIIDIMKETPEISVKEIADILNISVGGVKRCAFRDILDSYITSEFGNSSVNSPAFRSIHF